MAITSQERAALAWTHGDIEAQRAERMKTLRADFLAKLIEAREPVAVMARIGREDEARKAMATLVVIDNAIAAWGSR